MENPKFKVGSYVMTRMGGGFVEGFVYMEYEDMYRYVVAVGSLIQEYRENELESCE